MGFDRAGAVKRGRTGKAKGDCLQQMQTAAEVCHVVQDVVLMQLSVAPLAVLITICNDVTRNRSDEGEN